MNKEIKKENKKALPVFFMLVCLGGVVGLLLGVTSTFAKFAASPEQLVENIYDIFRMIEPYDMCTVTIVFGAIELFLYQKAKKLSKNWDGEDEAMIELAESKLHKVLAITSFHQIIAFFLFAFTFMLMMKDIESDFTGDKLLISIIAFLISMAFVTVFQQKSVDLDKYINPEKKGSVFDIRFAKKWMESCDENERRKIGQASYKAYRAVLYTCQILWILLFFAATVFDTGILPIFVVSIIWAVTIGVYYVESGRGEINII